MSSVIGYKTCTESWDAAEDDIVIVKDASAERVSTFSLEFLRQNSAKTPRVEHLLRRIKAYWTLLTPSFWSYLMFMDLWSL